MIVLGSNAESFLMTREERSSLLKLARSCVPKDYPVIAGVSGHSTAQVLQYLDDAKAAGSDYGLLLPASYFGKQTTPQVVEDFFKQVADDSPLPIIIYNFPGVCNGLDLDSELISRIAQHPKIVGVKLTCGSVAKVERLTATFSNERFATFGGQSDFLVGGLAAGSAGCVCAFGNVFPRTIQRIFDLWQAGNEKEAKELQKIIALAESPTKAGVANTKFAASEYSAVAAGIKDAERLLSPRRPYSGPTDAVKNGIRKTMQRANEVEVSIANQTASRL